MKKIFLLIILLFTGCTKYSDLNDLAIIKSIGISRNNEYTLYAEIIEEIDNNDPKMQVIKTKAKDISTLFKNIKLQVNKEIFLSHIDLILLDFSLKNDDYNEIIHYFLSNKEFRNDFLCIFSSNIEEVLNNSKYDEIEELIITNQESKNVINISFEEVIKNFLDKHSFSLSSVIYKNNTITFDDNYTFHDNQIERIDDVEKN